MVDVLWGGKWGETRDPLLLPLPLAQESTTQLAGVLAQVLHGEAPPSLGPFSVASPEDMQALVRLRGQLESQWQMLQVAGEAGGKAQAECLGPRGTPDLTALGQRASCLGDWGAALNLLTVMSG